ncbi:MAG TPA: hypothetical protein VES67_25600 [Vicinamibacterales bacterium]|nr:hypothetical protein [Vicinamibacterales bacterium]
MTGRWVRISLVLCLLLTTAARARAQATTDAPPSESRVRSALLFLAGAMSGLVAHEGGHIITGFAFDAHPRARRLDYGPIPFFSIQHDPVSRRKEFVIASSGFWIQHAGSEWLLTKRPNLARERAPFLKGVLVFNLAASVVYSAAAFGRFGPPERDTRAMAVSLGKDGVGEPVIGVLILAPAALDGYRYLRPGSTWAKWASRGAKITAVALTIAAGRHEGSEGVKVMKKTKPS